MMGLEDWIGLAIALPLWGVVLWAFWRFGDYEMTGRHGWRRIPAGARLTLDMVLVEVNRWIARQNRRRDG